MDHYNQVNSKARTYLLALIVMENLALIAAWVMLEHYTMLPLAAIGGIVLALGVVSSVLLSGIAVNYMMAPLKALRQLILHVSPGQAISASTDISKLKLGRELVANLAGQVYQLTDIADRLAVTARQESIDLKRNFIANNIPLPFLVLDSNETIQFANQAMAEYIGMPMAELVGKNVYMVMDMSFPSADTLDKWLKEVKQNSATAAGSWERVRLGVRDNHPMRLFDLATYYNKGNAQQIETMMVLFDHTKQYSQDEQAVSFIALSVHELRTPLTLLRGYIEVFEEELSTNGDPELIDFMDKMSATAQQLTAFVNNILNVARVDDDQMQLKLQEEDWGVVLEAALSNLDLRAKVRGITLERTIAPNLPKIGADRLSITEVVNNLIDNAIKYSNDTPTIKIETHLTQEGLVETTVQDFGLGISSSIMPNLFTKFYRDHRNRAQIGGTGLGLYLSKAIVTAHGGNMWVRSREGAGSTFGFTLQPYDTLAKAAKAQGDDEMIRGAHGWIKNHSLYRR
ncbi:PAS domain-containing protein [Polaromonas sp.]|nr:PAS domain-containing protein [Candidatus Saccharibacteria bacterium]